jgi:ABC-type proline/glycine betaine transport system permease subunit
LSGAIPAAGLALLADLLMGRLETILTPRGIRKTRVKEVKNVFNKD